MKKLENWIKHNRYPSEIPPLLALRKKDSYLRKLGWFDSYKQSIPQDKEGNAIPWYTYPSIHFFENRIKKDWVIFEYGSGNSTLWWSKRVASVVSCEHDQEWFAIMQSKIPSNVDYKYYDLIPSGDYSKAISATGKKFDVVIVDGRDRVNSAKNSLHALTPEGVIIWDNSDRDDYLEGYDFLIGHGFKRLDFWGMGPINPYGWCTSIFYRKNNCFNI